MTVTMEEAKERMEELAELAIGGEEVRITQGGVTTVELKAVEVAAVTGRRVSGRWKGKIELGESFFEPMPEEWLDSFYNGPVYPGGGSIERNGNDGRRNDSESKA